MAPGDELPSALKKAVATVARDLNLEHDWMNTAPGPQWVFGLPPGLDTRIKWQFHGRPGLGGLWVGLVDRFDLIFFKLYATADSTSTRSVHYQDLVALSPTEEELQQATVWVRGQDASSEFHVVLEKALLHLRTALNVGKRHDAK